MTIAAGFLYDEGLLLCADTQFTSQLKLHGSKILPYTYDDKSKSAFVTVGHARYARMCVQSIQDAIASLAPSDRTLSKMHAELISGLKELFQGHVFQHPRSHEVGAQFLVGLWSAQDKTVAFFSTEDTAVARMFGYDCLGSGETLAHRFIRPKYKRVTSVIQKPRHTEAEVRKMALDALREVKNFDPYCGGHSECLTLTSNGDISPVQILQVKNRP